MKKRSNFRAQLQLSGALVALAAAVAPSAYAQAAEDDGEIVVTATKRETNLQDTPIAISVVGAGALEDRHAQSLLDLNGAIPSLRTGTFESRQGALTVGIRGIVPNDANQPAREQGVGVYLDGVYLGRQHGLNASLLDIERIEVLKGPQGTLFGRNTEGGAVNMITRGPSGEFDARLTVGAGNLGAYNADAHLDLPEFHGISIKLDAATQYRDPVTENPMSGQTGWGYYDREGFRATVLWEPTENFSAQYAYDWGHELSTPYYSQLINYNPLNRPIATTFPIPSGTIAPLPSIVGVHPERQEVADIGVPQNPSLDNSEGHSVTVNWDIMPSVTLRSITAYRSVGVDQWDNAGGANRVPAFAPNGNFSRYSLANFNQFQRSQEFQLIGGNDTFEWLIGYYIFNEKVWDDAATPSTNRWNATGTAYTINNLSNTLTGNRSLDRASIAWAESNGFYVHAVWTPPILDENFHLTLGGRQTSDSKHGILYRVNNAPRNFTFDISEDRFDPVVTLAYDLTDDINVYATYSTGYRAGGASSRSLTYRSFGPEEVESIELGAKMDLFDRLRVNIAVFDMDRTNSQFDFTLVAPDPVTGASRNTVETINAPGVTQIRGIELDANWNVTDNLSVSFAYAYTDTNVPRAVNPFSGVSQNVYVIYTPLNAASASLDWEHPLSFGEFRFHIDVAYADGAQSFEQYAQKTDANTIVNARVSLADIQLGGGTGMTLSLWSRNLLDEEHIYRRSEENRTTLGDYANFNEPRTFGAELSLDF